MATTRKGWRSLTIDGNPYRWKVMDKTRCWDTETPVPLKFTVESAQGALLLVNLGRPRPVNIWLEWDLPEATFPVTPSEVEREVRKAMQAGWEPKIKSKPFFHQGA